MKETKHENNLPELFKKYHLRANIPLTMLDIGGKSHPVLKPSDFISTLSVEGKLDLLFCNHTGVDYQDFWAQWRLLQGDHPVFSTHGRRLHTCVPVWVYADEGTSQKKKAIMILQFQPVLGWGSKRASDVNMLGVSTTNRFLYSVMSGRVYAGKKKETTTIARPGYCFCQTHGGLLWYTNSCTWRSVDKESFVGLPRYEGGPCRFSQTWFPGTQLYARHCHWQWTWNMSFMQSWPRRAWLA